MNGGPDIAVEVVSRDSRLRDYGEKKLHYQEAGVAEYWIVDPLQNRVEFHRLSAHGYKLVPMQANRYFHSQILSGFWMNIEWLLAYPLPPASRCLQELLGTSP